MATNFTKSNLEKQMRQSSYHSNEIEEQEQYAGECADCDYRPTESNFCGYCLKKILREFKQKRKGTKNELQQNCRYPEKR